MIFYAINTTEADYGIYSVNLLDNSVSRWTYDSLPPADPKFRLTIRK